MSHWGLSWQLGNVPWLGIDPWPPFIGQSSTNEPGKMGTFINIWRKGKKKKKTFGERERNTIREYIDKASSCTPHSGELAHNPHTSPVIQSSNSTVHGITPKQVRYSIHEGIFSLDHTMLIFVNFNIYIPIRHGIFGKGKWNISIYKIIQ